MGGRRLAGLVVVAALATAGCTAEPARTGAPAPSTAPSTATSDGPGPAADAPTSSTSPSPATSSTASPEPQRPPAFDADRARAHVVHLSRVVGPRLATGPGFAEAAAYVEQRLRRWGYSVRSQPVRVPAGSSWGVPVPAGTSANVLATPPGFDPTAPHRLVGAHLDTVAVSPGAEDNGSGVGVLLELARVSASTTGRAALGLPTVFVAFGAEEPIGPADDQHHLGSQQHVASLAPRELAALRAVVSLDRVGVGARLPVSATPEGSDPLRDRLLAIARTRGVAAFADEDGTSSDHWSYAKAGVPAARLGSTPYAGYHSPQDLPAAVSTAQLRRAGLVALGWLRSPAG